MPDTLPEKIKKFIDKILSKHPIERKKRLVLICVLAILSILAIILIVCMHHAVTTPEVVPEAPVEDPNGITTVDTSKKDTKTYSWTTHDGKHKVSLNIDLYADAYEYYRQVQRSDTYLGYVTEEYNAELCKTVANELTTVCGSLQYTGFSVAQEAVAFVNSLSTSLYDPEWTKFPTELLYEGYGDCKDNSIFLAALLKELGYKTALIVYSDHMAVGISTSEVTGYKFSYNGVDYSYIEVCESGYSIGTIPDAYQELPATIIPLQ